VLLDVVLGYDCNLACDYCTITPAMRRRELTTLDVLRALDDGRARGCDTLSLTGGEPTIRRDLVGLIRAAKQRGYRDIKLQSNGLMFSAKANVDALIGAGVTRFHVSIHTHDARLYDGLVRRDDSYRLMVAGLDNVVASGAPLVADVIIKNDTFSSLSHAMAWLHARGVRAAHLWFVSLTDGNRDNVASMPRMTEVLPEMHAAFDFARKNGMDVRSLHIPRCLLGDDAAHAYDPGADAVRVVTPEASFDLRDSRLAGHTHVAACDGCRYREICPGIRPDYLARFGDGEFRTIR
jgi:cyclic pyranopterin phosphate synthase